MSQKQWSLILGKPELLPARLAILFVTDATRAISLEVEIVAVCVSLAPLAATLDTVLLRENDQLGRRSWVAASITLNRGLDRSFPSAPTFQILLPVQSVTYVLLLHQFQHHLRMISHHLGSRGREVESLELDAAVKEEDEEVEFVVHAGSLGLEVDEGTTRADPPFL
ncbi:hypothetical protein PS2_014026 [Malus domestica]